MTSTSLGLGDPSLLRDKCYIDGAWVGGAATHSREQSRRRQLRRRARVGAAERAAPSRRRMRAPPPGRADRKGRAAILRKWFDLMMANQEDLAR